MFLPCFTSHYLRKTTTLSNCQLHLGHCRGGRHCSHFCGIFFRKVDGVCVINMKQTWSCHKPWLHWSCPTVWMKQDWLWPNPPLQHSTIRCFSSRLNPMNELLLVSPIRSKHPNFAKKMYLVWGQYFLTHAQNVSFPWRFMLTFDFLLRESSMSVPETLQDNASNLLCRDEQWEEW